LVSGHHARRRRGLSTSGPSGVDEPICRIPFVRAETNGVDLTEIQDLPKLFPIVNAKTDTEPFADLDATVAWAKSQGGDANRLGIIGFCRGGRNVWHYFHPQSELEGHGCAVMASP
jgi:dienelactone hydrolase